MVVTEDGIVIEVRPVQPENPPIVVNEEGSSIEVRLVQFSNA